MTTSGQIFGKTIPDRRKIHIDKNLKRIHVVTPRLHGEECSSVIVNLVDGSFFINNEISKKDFEKDKWLSNECVYSDGSVEFSPHSRKTECTANLPSTSRRIYRRPRVSKNQIVITHLNSVELHRQISGRKLYIQLSISDSRIDFIQKICEGCEVTTLSTEQDLIFQFDVRINQENASIIKASDGGCGNVRIMHRDEFMQYRKNLQTYRKKLNLI